MISLLKILGTIINNNKNLRNLSKNEKEAHTIIIKLFATLLEYERTKVVPIIGESAFSRNEYPKKNGIHIVESLYEQLGKKFVVNVDKETFLSVIPRFKTKYLLQEIKKRYTEPQLRLNM